MNAFSNIDSGIVAMSDDELDQVGGGYPWIAATALVVGIAAGLVYLGGEAHAALCTSTHKS